MKQMEKKTNNPRLYFSTWDNDRDYDSRNGAEVKKEPSELYRSINMYKCMLREIKGQVLSFIFFSFYFDQQFTLEVSYLLCKMAKSFVGEQKAWKCSTISRRLSYISFTPRPYQTTVERDSAEVSVILKWKNDLQSKDDFTRVPGIEGDGIIEKRKW